MMPELKILQANVGRSTASHDMAISFARKENYDMIAFNEPNISKCRGRNCYTSLDKGAMTLNLKSKVYAYRCLESAICVETEEYIIYNAYFSPNNCSANDFEENLHKIENDIRQYINGKGIIITGDLNAKNPCWGGQIKNKKGEILNEWINSMNMSILNDGQKPTCLRANGVSYIDVSIVCEKVMKSAPKWKVLDTVETLSDHDFTSIDISIPRSKNQKIYYIHGLTDKSAFGSIFRNQITGKEVNEEECSRALTKAFKDSTPRIRPDENKKTPYWWNYEIQNGIKETIKKRRKFQKNRLPENRENLREQYKQARNELKKKISSAKKKAWDELCNRLNMDIYGDAYNIIRNQLKTPTPRTELSIEERIKAFEELFIYRDQPPLLKEISVSSENISVTEEEMKYLISRIKTNKAPGPDGIPPSVIKMALEAEQEYFRTLLEKLFTESVFPKSWKEARLILIEKPRKGPTDEIKYRPICLINVVAKVFESLINKRLTEEIKQRGDFNDGQFGFREGRSTVDAIGRVIKMAEEATEQRKLNCLILVDVKNAFNSAAWDIIIERLREMGISAYLLNIVIDYLSDRNIILDKTTKRRVTGGVPQGSVLGPTLWNVLYDQIMAIDVGNEVGMVCYADDLAISISARTSREIIAKTNRTLHAINLWMKANKLQLAPEKTEAIIINRKKKITNISFVMEGVRIKPVKRVKYLGMVLDAGLNYGGHIAYATEKAQKTSKALCAILPNVKGPGANKRKVLALAMQSILTYAAPIWAKAMDVERSRTAVLKAQRVLALRVCSAYRTVSTDAALVIAGLIPVDLMARERKALYYDSQEITEEVRSAKRTTTISNWQSQWNASQKGRWTNRLLGNILPWINRRHGEINYRLTQCLTGHGVFYSYLHKIGKANSPSCTYCNAPKDDAQHTLFECTHWINERQAINRTINTIGNVTPDTIISRMLETQDAWNAVAQQWEKIITTKEDDERRNQREV
jgi:hypothetical protein